MEEKYVPSEYAVGFLKEIKKDYQKMEENCLSFEIDHESFCRCINLDIHAFDIEMCGAPLVKDIFDLHPI